MLLHSCRHSDFWAGTPYERARPRLELDALGAVSELPRPPQGPRKRVRLRVQNGHLKMLQENLRRTLQHRLPVFLYLAAVVTLAVALIYFGWVRTWSSVYLPRMYPPFADMRGFQGAISLVEQGYDPRSPPWEFDQPLVWITIGKMLNFSSEPWLIAECAALVFCFVGLCAFLLFCYPSFGLLASLVSTSTLLGIERGNTDLVIFCLLFLAATWFPNRWSSLPLLLATLLKLFPIFALTGMFIKRQFILFAASLAGAVAIFAYLWDQLADIHSRVPVECALSFGLPSITDCFIQRGFPPWEPWALFAALGFAVLTLTYYFSKLDAATLEDDAAFDLLLVGAPIYVGTFMVASNFDYRLIFLILCIPFLQRRPFPFARTLIVVMLIAMNERLVSAWLPKGWVVVQLAKSAIFVVLSAYLLALAWAALASLDAKRKLIAANGTAELTPIEPPGP